MHVEHIPLYCTSSIFQYSVQVWTLEQFTPVSAARSPASMSAVPPLAARALATVIDADGLNTTVGRPRRRSAEVKSGTIVLVGAHHNYLS